MFNSPHFLTSFRTKEIATQGNRSDKQTYGQAAWSHDSRGC